MAVLTRVTKRFDQAYRLVVYAPKKQYQVIANESAIEELLTILIENALKYSPPESLVTIEVAIRDQKLQVSISNGGKGIPPEHLPHIFTRFYRIDTARTGRSGHGLGLALAHQISELHNAKLSVSSIPNHSTVFAFSLPIFRQHKAKNHKKSVTNPQP